MADSENTIAFHIKALIIAVKSFKYRPESVLHQS